MLNILVLQISFLTLSVFENSASLVKSHTSNLFFHLPENETRFSRSSPWFPLDEGRTPPLRSLSGKYPVVSPRLSSSAALVKGVWEPGPNETPGASMKTPFFSSTVDWASEERSGCSCVPQTAIQSECYCDHKALCCRLPVSFSSWGDRWVKPCRSSCRVEPRCGAHAAMSPLFRWSLSGAG
jgi:hypothetical protein